MPSRERQREQQRLKGPNEWGGGGQAECGAQDRPTPPCSHASRGLSSPVLSPTPAQTHSGGAGWGEVRRGPTFTLLTRPGHAVSDEPRDTRAGGETAASGGALTG